MLLRGTMTYNTRCSAVIPSWYFQNATTIRFTEAPEGKLLIYRKTDIDELEAIFYPGSSIKAQDLNDNFEQLRDAIRRWSVSCI